MKPSVALRTLALPLVLLLSGAAALGQPAAAGPGADRETQLSSAATTQQEEFLETFDAAWRIINDSYFDPTFHGVNWPDVRDELRPAAQSAQDVGQLRDVLEEMLHRLGDSHMAVIPGSVAQSVSAFTDEPAAESAAARPSTPEKDTQPAVPAPKADLPKPVMHRPAHRSERGGDLGFDMRVVGNEVLVVRVDSAGPAANAGVRPGWVVETVDQQSLRPLLESVRTEMTTARGQFVAWGVVSELVNGRPGSTVELVFRDGHDARIELRLERRREPGEPAKLGYLPALYSRLESESMPLRAGGTVGVIRFNLWMVPVMQAFDQAIDRFRRADGIILDLRGNFGGLGAMILGVSGHFFNERVSLGTLKMRGNELRFYANPRQVNAAGERVQPYAGPVAILVDGLSLSAAEIFAGGMQDVKRARIFGERSGGQALPAVWDRLPNGDVLYHAFGDFVTAAGTRLEGRGVLPDQVAVANRADLLAGRDAPLSEALDWIATVKAAANTKNAPMPGTTEP